MKLLEVIEDHVGQIDFWPSYILIYIFADHPSPVASSRLKKVIAFLFGNDVPCELACRFYQAYNGTASWFVGDQFQEWYDVWLKSRNKLQMAMYYNMRLGKHMYINGSCYNQSEHVMPKLPVLKFGIGNTGCRLLILGMLEDVGKLESDDDDNKTL
jgi:hypothetical protein